MPYMHYAAKSFSFVSQHLLQCFNTYIFMLLQWFHYENFYLKVPESRFHSDPIKLDSVFSKPSTGVDVQEFREMLKQYLDMKLGSGQHTELLEDLMDFADVNRDSRVRIDSVYPSSNLTGLSRPASLKR